MTVAWRRFRGLPADDRRLVIQAALLLGVAWAGLRVASYRRVLRLLERRGQRGAGQDAETAAERIAWAVEAAAKRSPMPMTCLVRALAAHGMLRQRGLPSQLRLGVRVRGERAARALESHAWVQCGTRMVVGQLPDLDSYRTLRAPGVQR